jgi:hypothetical protein
VKLSPSNKYDTRLEDTLILSPHHEAHCCRHVEHRLMMAMCVASLDLDTRTDDEIDWRLLVRC